MDIVFGEYRFLIITYMYKYLFVHKCVSGGISILLIKTNTLKIISREMEYFFLGMYCTH